MPKNPRDLSRQPRNDPSAQELPSPRPTGFRESTPSGAGSLTRRDFVTHAAAAGGGAVLSGVAGAGAARASEAPGPGTDAGAPPGSGPQAPLTVPKRPFGNTGEMISSVGFGAGSRFYTSVPSDEESAELIRQAIDRGIEFVETGANYGGEEGISEKRIGLAMRTHRDKCFLETKVDARDYDGAMREMERSLERMQTDHLDLVLHHFLQSREEVVQVARIGGAEEAIRKMVEEGVVGFRGFSTHLPDVALEGMQRLVPQAVQLPINAVRVPDFEEDVIAPGAERGIAFIAMKTCGNGYFHPASATTPDRIVQYGPPPGAWEKWDIPDWTDYIHYVLTLPIATATIGIDSYFTLNGVVAAASGFEPLSPQRMRSISQRAQIFSTTGYWIPRG
jgi:predicted aldo/keto reductase-like oxidoreductase